MDVKLPPLRLLISSGDQPARIAAHSLRIWAGVGSPSIRRLDRNTITAAPQKGMSERSPAIFWSAVRFAGAFEVASAVSTTGWAAWNLRTFA